MSKEIILYDLANKRNVCWSSNPWKTRMLLNFKGVPYTTEWIEYPDLAPKFKTLGIPPNAPGAFADYSSPTVRLPDGTYVMDSDLIKDKIEQLYPSPRLHLEIGLHKEAGAICSGFFIGNISQLIMPIMDILQEPSQKYMREDRERRSGMTLEQLQAKGPSPVADEQLKKLQVFCTSHKRDDGPFIMGSQPVYADLMVASLFEALERLNVNLYNKVMNYDEAFKKLHDACRPWAKKDD